MGQIVVDRKEGGDYGLPRRQDRKTQIVAIFDLVGFTTLESNSALLGAVREIEHELQIELDEYYWDERDEHTGNETYQNNILLRSTGDGYIVAFSEGANDLKVLNCLTQIHSHIKKNYGVRLGINKGENLVVSELNDRVNIIGWGINLAARALMYAERNQIICTDQFADPLLRSHGDKIDKTVLTRIGRRKVKNSRCVLYNYYKHREFGAKLTPEQQKP